MKIDFARDQKWWNAKAPAEERDGSDERINRALRWIEIEKHLKGVKTILDIGGATGAFSIPLAKRGFKVTYVDFSLEMLKIAKGKAKGVKNLDFVRANSTNLSMFKSRGFDLVLNMDGAVSFSGSMADKAIAEACRVTRKKLILTVSNLSGMIPVLTGVSLKTSHKLLRCVYAMFERGLWHQERFPENRVLAKGLTQDYLGTFKAYSPERLRSILKKNGMEIVRLGALGSLSQLCGAETLSMVLKNKKVFNEFVNLCDRFDKEILPYGPGTRQRAGLLAVAKPQ